MIAIIRHSLIISLFTLAPLIANSKKPATNSTEDQIARCQKERWQRWCHSNSNPPTPQSGERSDACLQLSDEMMRTILWDRGDGLLKNLQSFDKLKAANVGFTDNKASVARTNAQEAKSQASAATVSFDSCQQNSAALKKYFSAYGRDKESTRSFCERAPRGANERMVQEKSRNLNQAIQRHYSYYKSMVSNVRKALNAEDLRRLKAEKLNDLSERDYSGKISNFLSAVEADCKLGAKASRESLQLAEDSNRIATNLGGEVATQSASESPLPASPEAEVQNNESAAVEVQSDPELEARQRMETEMAEFEAKRNEEEGKKLAAEVKTSHEKWLAAEPGQAIETVEEPKVEPIDLSKFQLLSIGNNNAGGVRYNSGITNFDISSGNTSQGGANKVPSRVEQQIVPKK